MRKTLIALAMFTASCGSGVASDPAQDLPDLPPTDAASFAEYLTELDRPVVVNVWASWCLPCRSEAPLLEAAHRAHGGSIEFIGVDVQDTQDAAKEFLAEYSLDFTHFFDRGRSVPESYGAFGTPVTMFFSPGGELVQIHNGIVDDRTLALGIDELLRLVD